jgi:primosomal protein N'
VLLGSATPSLESYHNAKSNKYGLIEMFFRFNNVVLPEIHLIDLKDKYFRKRMDGHFSDELLERINKFEEKYFHKKLQNENLITTHFQRINSQMDYLSLL